MEPNVFISYRRSELPGMSRAIYEGLKGAFGAEHVFFDVGRIEPGEDWRARISEALGSTVMQLVLIGPEWADLRDEHGARKLDSAEDLVRYEIAEALQRGIRVVPVLLEGAAMPPLEAFPPDVQALQRFHAYEVRDSSFDRDLDGLIEAIRRRLRTKPRRRLHLRWGIGLAGLGVVSVFAALLLSDRQEPGSGVPPPPPPNPGNCLNLVLLATETLPYYLINSLGSDDFPYWFRVEGENRCDYPVHLEVFFTSLSPAMRISHETWTGTLLPDQNLARELEPPNYQILEPDKLRDEDVSVQVKVEVKKDDGETVQQNTVRMRILRADTLHWDLIGPGDSPISKDFLLASLAAWTKVLKDNVLALSAACRGEHGSRQAEDPDLWLPVCYQALHERITVEPAGADFLTLRGRQPISSADEVLASGNASPLEAFLTLAALGRTRNDVLDTSLGLLATKPESGAPALLFIWRRPGSDWQAVSAADWSAPFSDNRDASAELLQSLIDVYPGLLSGLDARGLFINEQQTLFAVDFGTAAYQFLIGGLP
jgi:hypothetical protein